MWGMAVASCMTRSLRLSFGLHVKRSSHNFFVCTSGKRSPQGFDLFAQHHHRSKKRSHGRRQIFDIAFNVCPTTANLFASRGLEVTGLQPERLLDRGGGLRAGGSCLAR